MHNNLAPLFGVFIFQSPPGTLTFVLTSAVEETLRLQSHTLKLRYLRTFDTMQEAIAHKSALELLPHWRCNNVEQLIQTIQ